MKNMIQIDNLCFSFGKTQVLNHIDLNVPSNSIYGFLGPNGAGKSTTIRCILNLLRPEKGTISIMGKSLDKDRNQILQNIGATIEYPSLYGHLNAIDNLEITRKLVGAPASRIPFVLTLVGLKQDAHRKTKTYSMGMKQRLTIAMALLNDPELLILDEPMNGLDPSGINEMRRLIHNLHEAHGKTIFLSSHILSEIEKTATHIGVINKGKIIKETTIDNIIAPKNIPLSIVSDNNQSCFDLLMKLGKIPHRVNDHIEVDIESHKEAASINAHLVNNKLNIFELTPLKENLENIYLDLIEK